MYISAHTYIHMHTSPEHQQEIVLQAPPATTGDRKYREEQTASSSRSRPKHLSGLCQPSRCCPCSYWGQLQGFPTTPGCRTASPPSRGTDSPTAGGGGRSSAVRGKETTHGGGSSTPPGPQSRETARRGLGRALAGNGLGSSTAPACPCPVPALSQPRPRPRPAHLEAGPLPDALPAGPAGQGAHEGGHALRVQPALLVHVEDVQLDQLPGGAAAHAEVEPGPGGGAGGALSTAGPGARPPPRAPPGTCCRSRTRCGRSRAASRR